MKTPHVYVIIVNYQGWSDTVECLESLLRSDYSDFSVLVVDNKSPNDSVSKIMQWASGELPYAYTKSDSLKAIFDCPRTQRLSYRTYTQRAFEQTDIAHATELLSLIEADENKGFAAGNNVVLRKLLQEDACVWLLNPDIVVEPDTLSKLVACYRQHSHNTIIGTPVKSYDNPDTVLNYGSGKVNSYTGTISFITHKNQLPSLEYISGGSLFTHSTSFKELGLLEEKYFLYWEETDWCFHAAQSGYSLIVCEQTFVYDKISTSIGKGFLAEYYYTLNSLKFFKKYKRPYIPFVLTSNILRLTKRLLSNEFERGKAIWKATMVYLSKAK